MLTVVCESSKSTMQQRQQQINISVVHMESSIQVSQGDRCIDDEVEFRFDIEDFSYMIGNTGVGLYQNVEQRYTECPLTCSIDSKLADFIELQTYVDNSISLDIYTEEATLAGDISKIGLRCESIRSTGPKRVATDIFSVKFMPQT